MQTGPTVGTFGIERGWRTEGTYGRYLIQYTIIYWRMPTVQIPAPKGGIFGPVAVSLLDGAP